MDRPVDDEGVLAAASAGASTILEPIMELFSARRRAS
jgi:hypothetical protein